ncbi:hypothetical protein Tco_1354485 [Tanacetum coccineum]
MVANTRLVNFQNRFRTRSDEAKEKLKKLNADEVYTQSQLDVKNVRSLLGLSKWYNGKHNDDAMTLSEALAKINAKEELVKQHIKVAEEAISGSMDVILCYTLTDLLNYYSQLQGNARISDITIRVLEALVGDLSRVFKKR